MRLLKGSRGDSYQAHRGPGRHLAVLKNNSPIRSTTCGKIWESSLVRVVLKAKTGLLPGFCACDTLVHFFELVTDHIVTV
jgi:hypothetical protein